MKQVSKDEERIGVKNKSLVSVIVLAWLLLVEFLIVSVHAQYGPVTPNMLIHIYNTDDLEFRAFQIDTGAEAIDFVDWPLTRDRIDLWQTPAYSSYIQLKDYSEIGLYKIDLNNQRWPTGNTLPRIWDEESASYKHYYDATNPIDVKATEFRQAIAYLSDKDGWITRVLMGYGNRIDTDVPVPALEGYTDYPDLRSKALIYDYNTVIAALILDYAGFVQGSTPNPYYDPATPSSAQYLRTDPIYDGDLQPLVFYIRTDDVLRRDIGRELTVQLRRAGIQVNAIEKDRIVCYGAVMGLYDYHLYTGGSDVVGLDADIPNSLYNQLHSSQYWGGTPTSYFGGLGWSRNYIGFADYEYDSLVEQCKFGSDFDDILTSCLQAQERAAELVHSIPAYSRAGVKAYKRGWTGIVNFNGKGPDNGWTFLNCINAADTPENPADGEIDWGFTSNLTSPNPVTAEWSWDRKLIGLTYESMIGRNPYDLSMDYGFMAQSWSFDPATQSALFTLRPGLTFHNGDPVTPQDVKFSLEFQRACGPSVAWLYSELEPITNVDTSAEDPLLGPLDIRVYFSTASYWALHWAGYVPILNRNVWMAANVFYGWGYIAGVMDPSLFPSSQMVRNYNPWAVDLDTDGDSDFEEDGSGPWTFQSYTPIGPISDATSISLSAFSGYAIPQAAISDYLSWSFWLIGDVNLDGLIDPGDGLAIQKAFGTDTTYPFGTDWDQYNHYADINYGAWDMVNQEPAINGDGFVDSEDYAKWSMNFGASDDLPSGAASQDSYSDASFVQDVSRQTAPENPSDEGTESTPRMYVDTYPPSGSPAIIDESLRPGQIPISGASKVDSYPSNYATNGSVTDPTYAYDQDQNTCASFNIGATTYPYPSWFEVKDFNVSIAEPYHVLGIDIRMLYTVTLTNAQYRILMYVGTAYSELLSWTSIQRPTKIVRTWLNREEPNDRVWNWTDISNIRLCVEVRKTTSGGSGTFKEYESWASVPVNRLVISVCVENVQRLHTFQFDLNWTGPILNVTYIREGSIFKTGARTALLAKTYNGANGNRTITSNTLVSRLPVPRGVDGSGSLVYVEFLVESYGVTNLTLSRTRLVDSFRIGRTHTTTNGYFDNRIPGDITGPENPVGSGKYPYDGKVDCYDLIYLGKKYGTSDPVADFTGSENPVGSGVYPPDGIVDHKDLIALARNYGKHYP